MFKNFLLICSFFSCYNISALVTYLAIKHIYIVSHVSRIDNSSKVGLSLSKKVHFICFNDSPLEMIEKAFYFILTLIWVGFLGVRFEVVGKITPCLKLVTIMLGI